MDRVQRIMIELTKCTDAVSQEGEIESVYLSTASIGVIAAQAMALRGELEAAEAVILGKQQYIDALDKGRNKPL